MEVDDASIAKAEDKTVLAVTEEGGSAQQPNKPGGSALATTKLLKLKHDKEEPPGESEARRNDSPLTATPFKLEVSGSEDEPDGDADEEDFPIEDSEVLTKASIRRKLLASPPLPEDSEDNEASSQLDDEDYVPQTAKKRRRFSLKHSSSNDFLLGYDEASGEAVLMSCDKEAPKLIKVEPEQIMEEVLQSAANSPAESQKSIKKTPRHKPAHSPQQSIRSASKSPLTSKARSPQIEAAKGSLKSSPKPHIVADGEETNGQPEARISKTPPMREAPPSTKKTLSIHDEMYKKPFDYGWKRELVWRANPDASKEKADVYFISPSGKKVRGRNEIIPLLEGDLSVENFCFLREPMGLSPELETVRSAKPSSRSSAANASLASALSPPITGKRVSKPKAPKGASPPPQGWTASKALKVNNAALMGTTSGSAAAAGTGSATGRHSSSSHNQQQHHGTHVSSSSSRSKHESSSHNSSHSSKSKSKKSSSSASSALASQASALERRLARALEAKETCSINCAKVAGQVPKLQCTKCFCLYHHECVGIDRATSDYRTTSSTHGREYICEVCGLKSAAQLARHSLPAKASASAANANAAASVSSIAPPNSNSSAAAASTAAATVPRPPAKGRQENKYPQTIAVVKGKKYVMVAKPLALPNEHVNDIENDLKQINESIRKHRKRSHNSQDSTQHNSHAAQAEQASKLFATNFFANVSYAYDSLLCILKYLKIHERPRAAAVCKLWHLAAKDTSLWQTVRMKNSKVSSWSGFAAALRRGETKHLDLRKMLLPSNRSEELWSDFCESIGTVCSLEHIDLCRCSARVVESLFVSNRQLRVLNALAINDDAINLENIALMSQLQELRLRTCESGVLMGDIVTLSSLTQLTHLSLTSIKGLGAKSIEALGDLKELKSLELGECGDFDSTFAASVLPKMKHLRRLRLENGQVNNVCTLEILDAVAKLPQLQQLELVNFDIKPGFDEKLSLCTNVSKLLIIPTYISQSATTNQIVLSAVQQVASTLSVFTWCVTVELLRVTALYVDQCEESTKKEKHHFDECIPVLKPVPGAPAPEEDEVEITNKLKESGDEANGPEVPQIEILPLDKVETILAENLPRTKYTIVKVPYHVTCKQHLVE